MLLFAEMQSFLDKSNRTHTHQRFLSFTRLHKIATVFKKIDATIQKSLCFEIAYLLEASLHTPKCLRRRRGALFPVPQFLLYRNHTALLRKNTHFTTCF